MKRLPSAFRFLATGLSFLLQLSALSAANIVNWDGGTGGQAYLNAAPLSAAFNGGASTANINYAGGVATDRQQIRPFSTTTVLSPTTNYPNGVDTTQYSTTFYGGWESIVLDSAGGTAMNAIVIRNGTVGSPADGSVFRHASSATLGLQFVTTSIVMFKKSDFLGGLNAGSLTLNSLSLTAGNPLVASGSASLMRGRWLVTNGSTVYLSQDTFDLDAGVKTITDFSTTQWSVYTPSTAAGTALNFQPSSFATVNFNDVQSVGYYAETWSGSSQILTGTGTINSGYNITDFVAIAVPEPGTGALAIGGLLLGLLRYRRRR